VTNVEIADGKDWKPFDADCGGEGENRFVQKTRCAQRGYFKKSDKRPRSERSSGFPHIFASIFLTNSPSGHPDCVTRLADRKMEAER
jgi:hypothetical protein